MHSPTVSLFVFLALCALAALSLRVIFRLLEENRHKSSSPPLPVDSAAYSASSSAQTPRAHAETLAHQGKTANGRLHLPMIH